MDSSELIRAKSAKKPEQICRTFFDLVEANSAKFRLQIPDRVAWDQVLEKVTYIPWAYSWWHKEFYRLYTATSHEFSVDLSCIIYCDNLPIGLWPNYLFFDTGQWHVGLFADEVIPPLYSQHVSGAMRKSSGRALQKGLNAFLRGECQLDHWQTVESFSENHGLSEWYRQLMASGGVPTLRHQMYVDLDLPFASYKSSMRKSYRSLITKGLRNFRTELGDASLTPRTWDEFCLLHQEVAGRVTRSKATWEAQFEGIKSGQAFAVFLRNDQGRMVGGGLFCQSRTEVYYTVGAYDRSLFELPLGHVVQYVALEEMQRRDLKWYKLGYRPFPQERSEASEKERSIAFFKEGFCTHLMPEYLVQVPTFCSPDGHSSGKDRE